LNGHPYVPLDELVHALDFAIKADGSQFVLQPQLASLDVLASDAGTKLVAHAGIPLDARVNSYPGNKVVITFAGVGSMLPSSRVLGDSPVQRIDVRTSGTVRNPQTQVTLTLAPGTAHGGASTDDQRDFIMAFNGSGKSVAAQQQPAQSANAPEATESATPQPSPAAPANVPVQVTAVDTQPQNGSLQIRIAVSGNTTYEWHRLRPPDNRFWLDVHNARLAIPPQNQPGSDPVTSIRVHQENPDTVRVALSLSGFDAIDVAPNATGVLVTVSSTVADQSSVPRSGSGTVGDTAMADASPASSSDYWKFSPRPADASYVAANPRLIVIDPGHGGSDPGSYRGDAVEKTITLDISKRVRDILTARGWQVILTRNDDRDVFAPNDSAHDELQARDDIANHNGARVFVSVHVNAFMNAGPHGATVYYYKPSDLALAQAVDKRIASELGLKNDGVVKDKLYVVHHADMPATLVETAFVSNPDDRALLQSPQWRQQMAQAIADGIEDYTGAAPAASSANGGE
jgi:N-acetylmuramoyl-L-alanine amidase CwlD